MTRFILLPLIAAYASAADAQARQRDAGMSEAPKTQVSIDVYEYESVDVHPSFPGVTGRCIGLSTGSVVIRLRLIVTALRDVSFVALS